ncbi:uridine kinase [Trifolium repens]|nr:uridine kinase [Trifolium repens]
MYAKFVKLAFDDFVLPSKKYVDVISPRGGSCIHILIRDKDISSHDFVFYSDRLIRLVVEHGLGHLPFTIKQVVTITGNHLSLYSLLTVFYFDVHHIIISSMGKNILFQLFEGELSFEPGIDFCRSIPNDRLRFLPKMQQCR